MRLGSAAGAEFEGSLTGRTGVAAGSVVVLRHKKRPPKARCSLYCVAYNQVTEASGVTDNTRTSAATIRAPKVGNSFLPLLLLMRLRVLVLRIEGLLVFLGCSLVTTPEHK